MAPTPIAPRLTDGAKKLGKFLEKHNITRAAAGKALHASDPTVCDWIGGKKRPRAEKRADIEVWTNGEVSAASWLTAGEKKARAIEPFKVEVPAPEAPAEEGAA
jgi:hypothetical protein